MQFQIPQFIDVEDKIVGPLALKQFLYLAGAAVTSFILFFILKLWLWIIITFILGVISVSFAFIKYNGQPLPKMTFLALTFLWRPRLYLWQRQQEYREVQIKGKTFSLTGGMFGLKNLWRDLMTSKSPIPKREKPVKAITDFEHKFQIIKKITGERDVARRVDYR